MAVQKKKKILKAPTVNVHFSLELSTKFEIDIKSKRKKRKKKRELTFGAYKTPAHIDMAMMAVAPLGSKVCSTDDAERCQHCASCCDTGLPTVVGNWAADATHQFIC